MLRRMAHRSAAALTCVVLLACGGDEPSGPATPSFAGTYAGSYAGSGGCLGEQVPCSGAPAVVGFEATYEGTRQ